MQKDGMTMLRASCFVFVQVMRQSDASEKGGSVGRSAENVGRGPGSIGGPWTLEY